MRMSLALLAACALTLAACDDSDAGDDEGIETLGDEFVDAFNADRNDEPIDASEVELTLTPTIEPFDP